MKKIILLVLCVALGVPGFAQKRSKRNQPDTVYVTVHDTIYLDQLRSDYENELIKIENNKNLKKAQIAAENDEKAQRLAAARQHEKDSLKHVEEMKELARKAERDSLTYRWEQVLAGHDIPCMKESLRTYGEIRAHGVAQGQRSQNGAHQEAFMNAKYLISQMYVGVIANALEGVTASVEEPDKDIEKTNKAVTAAKQAGTLAINEIAAECCHEFIKENTSEGTWSCYVAVVVSIEKLMQKTEEILRANVPEDQVDKLMNEVRTNLENAKVQ